jgi:hypothetical protein
LRETPPRQHSRRMPIGPQFEVLLPGPLFRRRLSIHGRHVKPQHAGNLPLGRSVCDTVGRFTAAAELYVRRSEPLQRADPGSAE